MGPILYLTVLLFTRKNNRNCEAQLRLCKHIWCYSPSWQPSRRLVSRKILLRRTRSTVYYKPRPRKIMAPFPREFSSKMLFSTRCRTKLRAPTCRRATTSRILRAHVPPSGRARGEEEIEEKSHENDDQEQLEHELHEEKRHRRYKYKVTSRRRRRGGSRGEEELQQDSDLDSSDKMADLLTASLETESKADEGLSERLFVQDALKEPLKEGPLQSQVENTDIQESERQKDREASRSTLRKGYHYHGGGYGYDGRRRRGGSSRGEEEIETASSETDGSTRPEDDDGGLSERLAVEDALQNQVENTDLQESQRQQALESSRATLRKGYYYTGSPDYHGGGYGYDGRQEQIQEKSKEKSRSYASLRKGSSRSR